MTPIWGRMGRGRRDGRRDIPIGVVRPTAYGGDAIARAVRASDPCRALYRGGAPPYRLSGQRDATLDGRNGQARGARGCRVRAGRDEFGDGRPRVGGTHQALADEDGVRARGGVLDEVERTAHPRLAILTTSLGSPGAMRSNVERSTSRVCRLRAFTPDDARAGIQGAARLVLGVHLDQRGHAQRTRTRSRSPVSVFWSSAATISSTTSAPCARASCTWYDPTTKSLRRQGNRHDARNRIQVLQRTAEAALLGQHADDARAAGLVFAGQRRGIVDVGERSGRRAAPLHLGR